MDKLTSLEKKESYYHALIAATINSFDGVSKEDVEKIIDVVIRETNKRDFFRFKEDYGDYPNMFCIPDEKTIKSDIYFGFEKKETSYLIMPRYESIDYILKKYEEKFNNDKLTKEMYSFLRIFVHLLYKVIFNISNVKDIRTITTLFTTNLDYSFVFSSKGDAPLRTVANPTKKYFNNKTNTIGLSDNIDKDSLELSFIDLETGKWESFFYSLFSVLDDTSNFDFSFGLEEKDKFQQYIVLYICTIMVTTSGVLAVCHNCGELYLRPSVNKENASCPDCNNYIEKKDRIILYKR